MNQQLTPARIKNDATNLLDYKKTLNNNSSQKLKNIVEHITTINQSSVPTSPQPPDPMFDPKSEYKYLNMDEDDDELCDYDDGGGSAVDLKKQSNIIPYVNNGYMNNTYKENMTGGAVDLSINMLPNMNAQTNSRKQLHYSDISKIEQGGVNKMNGLDGATLDMPTQLQPMPINVEKKRELLKAKEAFDLMGQALPKTTDIDINQYKTFDGQFNNKREIVNHLNNYASLINNTGISKGGIRTNDEVINSLNMGGGDILLNKINYIMHLLEQQKDEKEANITEEIMLYSFLGVFIIFVIDTFNKMGGKYVR